MELLNILIWIIFFIFDLLEFFVNLINFEPFAEFFTFFYVNFLNRSFFTVLESSEAEWFHYFLSIFSQLWNYRILNLKYLSDELSVRFKFLSKSICESIEVNDSAFEVFGVGKGTEFIATV